MSDRKKKQGYSKVVYLMDGFLWYALEAFSFHSYSSFYEHGSIRLFFLRNILVEQLLVLTRIVPISKAPNRQYMSTILIFTESKLFLFRNITH